LQPISASVQRSTVSWKRPHFVLPHAHVSPCAQQIGPPHSLDVGVRSTVRQKQPPLFELHSSGRHEHSCPAAGQPFGAQQMVLG
jgi:hypothetical protein